MTLLITFLLLRFWAIVTARHSAYHLEAFWSKTPLSLFCPTTSGMRTCSNVLMELYIAG